MFSLLSSATMQEVRQEIWGMRARVAVTAALCVVGVGLVALVPAYVDSEHTKVWSFGWGQEPQEPADPMMDETAQNDALTKQEYASQLVMLAREQSQIPPITPVVFAIRRLAVQFADIRLTRVAMSQGVFTVVGVASSREALLTLRSAFRSDANFTAADIPIAQLSGKNGEFPFSMTVVPVGFTGESLRK